jgi:cyclopropane fatty-acyl-phospholipid synthase-like methyltransferase
MTSPKIVEFISDALSAFTGLTRKRIDEYVSREHYPYHSQEWEFWKPRDEQDIRWFYMANRAYLFSNAKHMLPEEVRKELRSGERVLDFGGGCGSYAVEAAWEGCSVLYFDIGILQCEFVRFVANQHQLDIKVYCGDASDNWILPVPDGGWIDAVFALDVFEHIPEYPRYVKRLSEYMKTGGRMYVYAPFGVGDPTHIQDNHGFEKVMNANSLYHTRKIGVVDVWEKR